MKTLGICACIALCWISGFLSGAPSTAEDAKKLNKPFRVIAIILMLFLILVLLCSCGKEQLPDRFMKVADYNDCQIYVDLQTGVEYVSRGNTLAPLFNSYGSPLVYHGFDAREDRYPSREGGSANHDEADSF